MRLNICAYAVEQPGMGMTSKLWTMITYEACDEGGEDLARGGIFDEIRSSSGVGEWHVGRVAKVSFSGGELAKRSKILVGVIQTTTDPEVSEVRSSREKTIISSMFCVALPTSNST